jgi:uncharacterized membrane protein YhaH (DUF805 family)
MGFIEATNTCLKKCVVFSGRASRSEFWWPFAFLTPTIICLLYISAALENMIFRSTSHFIGDYHPLLWLTFGVSCLPLVSCGFRRLHDTGLPGLLFLLPAGLLTVAFFGSFLISGRPSDPNYNGYASWPFAIVMLCVFLVSVGGLLVALAIVSQPRLNKYGPNHHEVIP